VTVAAASSLIGLRGVGTSSQLANAGRHGLSALEAAQPPAIKGWSARSRQTTLLPTPTSALLLNMVKFFCRSSPAGPSVAQFRQRQGADRRDQAFIDGWIERCHPFVLTKTANGLLDHCRPGQRTSFIRHQQQAHQGNYS
jgi:hypothetical protein